MQYKVLGSTFYMYFAVNDGAGDAADGSTPLYYVRKGGASSSAAPVYSGTPTLLTHASYPNGCYEVAVAATSGNGFVADSDYSVFSTLAVDGHNPAGFIGQFTTAQLSAVTGNTASGSNAVTIAVVDQSAVPVAGAAVRIYLNAGDNQVATTNASGVVTFSAGSGDYTVSIAASGYSFVPVTLSITGPTTKTYIVTAYTPLPSSVGKVTCAFTDFRAGVVVPGETFKLTPTAVVGADDGIGLHTGPYSATGGVDGVVQFVDVIPGFIYQLGTASEVFGSFTLPADQTSPFTIPATLLNA